MYVRNRKKKTECRDSWRFFLREARGSPLAIALRKIASMGELYLVEDRWVGSFRFSKEGSVSVDYSIFNWIVEASLHLHKLGNCRFINAWPYKKIMNDLTAPTHLLRISARRKPSFCIFISVFLYFILFLIYTVIHWW